MVFVERMNGDYQHVSAKLLTLVPTVPMYYAHPQRVIMVHARMRSVNVSQVGRDQNVIIVYHAQHQDVVKMVVVSVMETVLASVNAIRVSLVPTVWMWNAKTNVPVMESV